MREVLYKTQNPKENYAVSDFINPGKFHKWHDSSNIGNDGCRYTVGIIENPDGTVIEVLPYWIKFVKPEEILIPNLSGSERGLEEPEFPKDRWITDYGPNLKPLLYLIIFIIGFALGFSRLEFLILWFSK